jgi:hypothetical protein
MLPDGSQTAAVDQQWSFDNHSELTGNVSPVQVVLDIFSCGKLPQRLHYSNSAVSVVPQSNVVLFSSQCVENDRKLRKSWTLKLFVSIAMMQAV